MTTIQSGSPGATRATTIGSSSDSQRISPEEHALLDKGNFIEFWRSRYDKGDPVARTALTGWGDPNYANASLFERAAAAHTWSDLKNYIKDNHLNVSMEEIGLSLAKAHAKMVDADQLGKPHLLSPQQVADYHHEVFAQYGIPAHIFGGTHQVGGHWYLPTVDVPNSRGWQPTMFDANTYSKLWCEGCDTSPK